MLTVSTTTAPLTNIITLKICACWENDISEFGFGAPPAVLINHKLQLWALVHLYPFISIGHSANEGATVAIEHLDFRAAWCGIAIWYELLVYRLSTKAFPDPVDWRIQDSIREE